MANQGHVTRSIARLLISALVLGSTITACGKSHLSGGPYEGLVRDKATGGPVAEALVLVRWMGTVDAMHSSSARCYYHEVVRTGVDGRFVVKPWKVSTARNGDPTWLPHVDPLRVEELVFKPGYRDHFVKGGKRDPMKIELEAFDVQPNEQIEFLSQLRYQGMCDGHSAKFELPWLQALAAEAIAIEGRARGQLTDWSRKLVGSVVLSSDEVEFGDAEAKRRRVERAKAATK